MGKVQKSPKVEKVREKTYKETKDLLNEYGKAAVIRPTGFGKTGLLTKFCGEYRSILYLYPAEVVRDTVLAFYYGKDHIPETRTIPNVDFMTYSRLVYMKGEEMDQLPYYDLIICDECHRLGATETQRAMDMLIERRPDSRLLGATATPDRMDLVDEIGRYFEDHVTYEYTLHDAFQDGMLKKPYYVFCNYADIEENAEYVRKETENEVSLVGGEEKLKLIEEMEHRLLEVSNVLNMPKTIKSTCDQYLPDTDYMRFIVFFSGYKALHEQGEKIREWFAGAYPDHEIIVTEVSSETDESRGNVLTLQTMEEVIGRIDLIYCCNMLTMGYHVPGLTGIVMARGTESNICYVQMLGRALSSGAEHAGIVFDIVDNIHTQSVYSMLGEQSKFTKAGKARKTVLEDKKTECERYEAYKDNNEEVTFTEEELEQFSYYDEHPDEAPVWNKPDERELKSLESRFDRDGLCSRYYAVEPKDLIVVSKEAKYREIIAKTVAEAKSMRARQAWARWIEQGGEPYDEHGRIRTRAEILKLLPPEHHPLPPYCAMKQVSVNAVLNEMNIKE